MNIGSNSLDVFFALLKAGLWEEEVRLLPFGNIDFNDVYRLASEQAVVGLVAAGIEHVSDVTIPKDIALSFAGETLQLEQRNKAMNCFIGVIVDKMRKAGICTLLVKGQGIAQCYDRPLWRASGDVDLFLDQENYYKAKVYLAQIAQTVEDEKPYYLHQAMSIPPWEVEIHGSLRADLGSRIDGIIDDIQRDTFKNNHTRVWHNGSFEIKLPSCDNDTVFVFLHILQHFYRGGIGLRQICDWCRLLWTFQKEININLLEDRVKKMGLIAEWKAFGALAVGYLGFPSNIMPLYDCRRRWNRKADKIISIILETGNFGLNKDTSYYKRHSRIISKVISVWKHTEESIKVFCIFPNHAILSWWRMVVFGCKQAIKGK